MYKRYTCLKTKINKEDLSYCNIFFDNNELLVIDRDELVDFHFTFYDKLIKRDQGIHPFVKEGLIKFKLITKTKHDSTGVFDQDNYLKNRPLYITNQFMQGGISAIEFYDNKACSKKIFGNFLSYIEDDYLCLLGKEKPFYEAYESEYHYIDLPNLEKPIIQSISLDFLDLNSLLISSYDIKEINIKMDEYLLEGSSFYERCINGGYLKFKLEKSNKYHGILFNEERMDISYQEAKEYLFNKVEHCIGNLFVIYHYPGYGLFFTEKIYIKDIRKNTSDDDFVGGHLNVKDDIVTITFE